MTQIKFRNIALSELHISNSNMRHSRKKPEIGDILPTIREIGLIQNLLVKEENGGFGVVAGRRRWFALGEVAKENETPDMKVPCLILSADDDAAAFEASLVENIARLPATEMERYAAFSRLYKAGRTISQVAAFFGVTETYTKQVMALGDLIEPIRKLYDQEEVYADTVRALTMATKEQQKEWLTLYKQSPRNAPTGSQCKRWLTGGSTISTDKALFDLSAYEGRVLADLFGDHPVFEDPDMFWELQSAAIAGKVAELSEAGWTDVIVMDRGASFHSWEHEKLARTKGGKVFVEISHDGSVEFHEGLITNAEARKLAKKVTGEGGDIKPEIRAEMSGPMAEYVGLHRHNATRAELLKSPGVAFRLMIAHALTSAGHFDVRSHSVMSHKEDTEVSIMGSQAEEVMTEAQAEIAELLETVGVNLSEHSKKGSTGAIAILAGLLRLGDDSVMKITAYVMADTLEYGGGMVEAVASVIGLNMAEYWKPEEAFFDLLRDKRAINAMVSEIANPALAKSLLTDTAKVQKAAICNRIIGEGCEANPDWMPKWMATPPARYVHGAPCHTVDAWESIKEVVKPVSDEIAKSPRKAA